MLNYKYIANKIGFLLLFEAAFMLLTVIVSLIYGENDLLTNALSMAITACFGFTLRYFGRDVPEEIGKKEGYLVVSIVWIVFSFFGTLPYWLCGDVTTFTDAFFETMSGFTTTGASIIQDVQSIPHGLLLWRSFTQFIGGIGILVLLIAILPVYGVGNMMLYKAEFSGANFGNKIKPRVKDIVTKIVHIYVFLEVLLWVILIVCGMPVFDALCHSLCTVSTGGFSVYNDSAVGFSPLIQYVVIVFMFIGGTNFNLLYLLFHNRPTQVLKDSEFRCYFKVVVIITLIITSHLFFINHYNAENAFRHGLFQVVSFITSTGFISDNYSLWSPLSIWLLLIIMVIGGCAGSTSGGVKMIRLSLFLKMIKTELKKIVHPRGIFPVKVNDTIVKEEMLARVLSFFLIYIIMAIILVTLLLMMNVDPKASVYSAITCLSNMGPGLGSVYHNYASLPDLAKWLLSIMMLVGRLEIFTILILLTKDFWKQS